MWNVNVWRVLNLARAANSVGATNVFFSTFMIFDGKKGMYTENTPPSPLNYYGITKLTGESAVAALGNYLILRVGLLYGIQSSLFAPALRNMMVNRKALCPSKFYVSPIGVKTFSRLVGELIRSRVRGIFNVATQRVDFHEFCRKVGDILGTTPIPAGSSGRDFSLDVWLLSTLGIKVSINYDVATMFGGS
jgi:dTDP-4-dehydrorhamnose reductase